MGQNLRAFGIFVLPLLVVLVTPSAFAQTWVSSVTVTTTDTAATINWKTAVPATSRVKYGLTTSYGTLSSLNSKYTTTHSVSLTALKAGTTYHYRVLSNDSTGVLVTGLDEVFTTPAATHSVALSWNASTSPDILGYNVYRAPYTTSCGAFAKLNPMLNTGTLYTDTTVANGDNYCYATTAVNTSNEESGYSNIVSNVQVPVL